MSAFYDNNITNVGRKLLADMQLGAKFVPTKIVIGSGYMPSDKTTQTIEDVVEVVQEISLNKAEKTTDGNCVFGGVLTNASVSKPFYFRELALYAKVIYPEKENKESAEVLYSYGNAKENAELIPAYSTGNAIERQMDLIVYIGNDTEVKLEIKSGLYVDLKEFQQTIQRIDAEIEQMKFEFHKISDKIGEPTDDHTKQTVFGKIASVLKRVIGIDDKVGTPSDSATQQTVFGKIKGIAGDVSGGLKPMNDKIGEPTDPDTQQTVFGKIADLKKLFLEKATEIISKITGMDEKVGTAADNNAQTSIFGRLKKVQETADTINTNMVQQSTLNNVQSTINTVNSKIGTTTDNNASITTGSVMGKLNMLFSALGGEQKFMSAGNHSFTIPAGVRTIQVIAVGGGGGGGGAYRSGTEHKASGGSGGSGGCYINQSFSVNEKQVLSIKIGRGGRGGTSGTGISQSLSYGADGEATMISNVVTVAGGKGGKGGTTSSAGHGSGTGGSGGSSSFSSQNGGTGFLGTGGKGGSSPAVYNGGGGGGSYGIGGDGGTFNSKINARNGVNGGGGGGAYGMQSRVDTSTQGGNGGDGFAIIRWGNAMTNGRA